MNNENQVNGQPVVDTTSNVVGAQPVQPQQPVMEPMQPQQTYTPPAGYTQYQAPQQQYAAPVNQYQPQGSFQQYQAPQGQYQSQYQYVQPTPSAPGKGFCVASLVLGIISVFFWALPLLNAILIVLAVIFGIVGLTKKHGDGKAIAGLIISGIMIIPTVIMIMTYSAIGGIFSWFTNTNTYKYNYNRNTYNYNRKYDLEDVIDSIFD
jgi:hypothetical protein